MNHFRLFVCVMTLLLMLGAVGAVAAPPKTISYQGYLKDGTGKPVTAATNLNFRLYSSTRVESGPLWSESRSVTPANGVYSVELGTVTPLDPLPFDRLYFLGVTVERESELIPRQPLTSAPYAIRAAQSDNVSTSSQIVSTVPDGTPPLWVSSMTLVPNLNADLLDSKHAGDFVLKAGDTMTGTFNLLATLATTNQIISKLPTGTAPLLVSSTTMVRNLNAEMVGGKKASDFVLKTGDTMTGTLNLPTNGLVVGTNQLAVSGNYVGIGTAAPTQKLTVAGTIESTSGGVKFPDGTVQTTAAAPTWHQILPAAQRFQLVMNDEAVLDRETGLVWQRSTDTTKFNWNAVHTACYASVNGGRLGWKLPTIEELETLIDPTQSHPALPDGHPFTNVKESYYWSSTTNASYPDKAWSVNFGNGYLLVDSKDSNYYVRCVRGGQ